MKARSQIGLTEAAGIAGKSPRQIMRDVKAGKLPARGGGRGVPYTFAPADVEAFRSRRSGVADVDLLARIACAFNVKRMVRHGIEDAATTDEDRKALQRVHSTCGTWLNSGFLMLWQWRKTGQDDLLAAWTRNGFHGLPRLAEVAPAVRDWARQIAQGLTPAEVDFLAAMFIVTEHPLVKYDAGEAVALSGALQAVKEAKPLAFASWQRFREFSESEMRAAWREVEGGVRADLEALVRESRQRGGNPPAVADLLAGERRIFFDPRKREGAWFMFRRHHPFDSHVGRLLSAYADASADGLRSLIEDGEDSQGQPRLAMFRELQVAERTLKGEDRMRAPSSLLSAARKEKRQRERQGRAKPSGAKVAAVLGVHRFQATRYWRGILRKVGRDGIAQLAAMLSLDARQVPRSWRVLRQRPRKGGRQARPLDVPAADAWNIGAFLDEEAARLSPDRVAKPRTGMLPSDVARMQSEKAPARSSRSRGRGK